MRNNKMRGALAVGVLAAGAIGAGAALADGTQLTASLSPATPKTATSLHIALGGADFEAAQGGRAVHTLKLIGPPGLVIDPKGVGSVCGADVTACPESSKIGSGSATFSIAVLGDITAPVTLYLKPAQAGDLAGVELSAAAFGTTLSLSARVTKPTATAGPMLLAENIDGQTGLMAGVKALTIDASGSAVVKTTKIKHLKHHKKKKITVKVTHNLITSPATCPAGGYPFSAELDYTDGSNLALTGPAPCA